MLQHETLADRNHHTRAGPELVEQGRRDAAGGRGDDDPIEGRNLRDAVVAVAAMHRNVGVALLAQPLLGVVRKRRDDLDRVHRPHQLGEHRRLIAGARTDLEDDVSGAVRSMSVINATMNGCEIVWP